MTEEKTSPTSPPPVKKGMWRQLWDLGRELRKDSDLSLRRSTLNGGVSTVMLAGTIGLALYAAALPIIVTAAVLAVCCGYMAVGVYSIAMGAKSSWERACQIYASYRPPSAKPKKPEKPKGKSFSQKFAESRFVQSAPVQAVVRNKFVRAVHRFNQKEKDIIINALVVNGSLAGGARNAFIIGASLSIIPTITLTSLLTFGGIVGAGGIVMASVGLAGSAMGIYVGSRNLIRARRAKKAEKTAAAMAPEAANDALPESHLTENFNQQNAPPVSPRPAESPPPGLKNAA